MKLILIHGVAQRHETAASLAAKWTGALLQGGIAADRLAAATPDMAFYADLLASGGPQESLETLPGTFGLKAEFLREVMAEVVEVVARQLKVSLLDAPSPAERADAERAFVRFIASPDLDWLREVREGFGEVFDYLYHRPLRDAIDALVLGSLRSEPQTIIAHSLGSVVAYRLLRDQRLLCRRLITIGSPLGFKAVRELLDGKFSWPAGLADWRNFYDKRDLIALGKPFTHSPAWRPRIIHTKVDNGDANNHGAMGYLKLPQVAVALGEVLS